MEFTEIENLPPKLKEALFFIRQFIQDRGYAPSVREIGSAIGVASTSTVHGYLQRLQESGFLRRDPSKPRAMILQIDKASTPSPSGDIDILPEEVSQAITGHSEKPFVSDTRTALPYIAWNRLPDILTEIDRQQADDGETFCLIPKSILDESACFVTTIPDDSMLNRQLSEGDRIIIRRTETANTSDIILCALHKELLVRTYYKGLRQVRLQAENDRMEAIMANPQDLSIIGVVIGFLRLF
ncbi:MAG: helix-turn-helix domain-containing protein [Clostridiales bacterium]|nr:helix-turn-helix domain-containing protein [Clostridiales bacterium]